MLKCSSVGEEGTDTEIILPPTYSFIRGLHVCCESVAEVAQEAVFILVTERVCGSRFRTGGYKVKFVLSRVPFRTPLSIPDSHGPLPQAAEGVVSDLPATNKD